MIPPIADRFVAGETAAEAIEHARAVNESGVRAILNLLGEHYHDPERAREDAAAYRGLVTDVSRGAADACISVKPSQLGLGIDPETFEENLGDVVDAAAAAGVFVWIDMEDHRTTDATLDAYEALAREHGGGVGVCVQANLRRTREDLERLAAVPGKVRLVKGAYDEPPALAYRGDAVDEHYLDCLDAMFETFEGGIAVGSHDQAMIDRAVALHEEHGTPFEIQMLMGVREDAQFELAREYDVAQYVPYGPRWFAYFSRRVAERRENLAFALRAILNG